ncbi:MFS transporter [Alicyclobacillus fastidiosus]|uniref:MFS transporter n=1 Tax=Alicyclobacillus fastidiosus TaxID=392011 RepID=A0ABV5ACN0_9BACL|nr:MFS transporter [Alicyclobacillus fastidiosus]WEH11281.1 MFS transporter [Alicyclobacillus fastidiosus]
MSSSSNTKRRPLLKDFQVPESSVWKLSGAHVLNDLMTTGLVPALLPLYKAAFHLSYIETTLIVLVSYITSSIIQPISGLITDRHPFVWLLPIGVFCTCFGLAISGIVPNYALLMGCIALSGFGSGTFHPEASRATNLAAGENRGLTQSIFQVGGNLGQAVGPLMMPLFIITLGLHGLLWFLIAAVLAFLLTWWVLPRYKQQIRKGEAKKTVAEGKRGRLGIILLVLVVAIRSWAQIGIVSFLPFYYLEQHIPLGTGDLMTFVFLFAGAIGTLIGGTISDRIGRKWLLMGSMILTIPFAWLLPTMHGLNAGVDLFFFGFFILSSFAVTVVYGQMMLPNNIGLASGLMIGFGVGAGGIGATFMGWIADHYAVSTVLDIIAILPIIAAIITFFLPNDKKLVRLRLK